MSALRDGESVKFQVGPNDTAHRVTLGWGFYIQCPSLWRRLWFLVSCIPRYLITGSVEAP